MKNNKSMKSKKNKQSLLKDIDKKLQQDYVEKPPKSPSTPKYTITRRFTTSGTVFGTFTLSSLYDQFLVATSTTVLIPTIYAVKIKSIKIWASAVSSTEGSCSLIPLGMTTDNMSGSDWGIRLREETTTIDQPAHISYKTKPYYPIGRVHLSNTSSSSGGLFALYCTDPGIVDITFTVMPAVYANPQGYSTTSSGLTVGYQYAKATPLSNLNTIDVQTCT